MNKLSSQSDYDHLGEDYQNSWHLVDPSDGERVFCDGLAVDEEIEGKFKTVNRGGITCVECLSKLKVIKAVRQ